MASRFETCIEHFLGMNVICEVGTPEEFHYLEDPMNFDKVHRFLMQIGRSIVKTRDQKAYYCVYTTLDDNEKRRTAQRQFDAVMSDFDGLVDWIRLVRNVSDNARPLETGDHLKESELLQAIENSNSISEQLERIAQKFKRAQGSLTTKNKLRSVLAYLKDRGFFIVAGTTGSVFTATGKWSLLYDELEYIHSFDGFEKTVAPMQSELF